MVWTEELRSRYRPPIVTALFVGEAPPRAGTFFYAANSQVYRYLREALGAHLGYPKDFLSAFAGRGYFLDDLVTEPVDGLSMRDRKPLFERGAHHLADRMAANPPSVIVTILMRIADHVEDARRLAGLDVPHHRVPFPGTGQQGNFKVRMAEVVPHLP